MIVPYQEVMEYVGKDDSFSLQEIHKAIEESFRNETHRIFQSKTYYNRRVNGIGSGELLLDQYPVTAITRLAKGTQPAIKIRNTSTDCSNAYAEVIYSDYAPTSLKLVVTGGDNNSSTTYAFSTYTTMVLLIAAASGSNGWSLEIYDTDFNSYPTTNLIEQKNLFAGSINGVARTSDEYLLIPGYPISDNSFWVEEESGILHLAGGFGKGNGNIIITYTAGYSASDMPSDIKVAIASKIAEEMSKRSQNAYGISRYSIGDLSVTYGNPDGVSLWDKAIEKYKRVV